MTPITDKIEQLPDGGELALQPPYIPVYICVSELKALVSELDRKTRALERTRGAIRSVLPHFESHQVYDKGSEAILQEALND